MGNNQYDGAWIIKSAVGTDSIPSGQTGGREIENIPIREIIPGNFAVTVESQKEDF